MLYGTFFICGASTNGLIQTHFIPLCADYGLAALGAASVLAIMGVFDFFGTVGSGWLSDRYDNRWLLFWYYGLRGLSLLYLPFTDFSFYGLSLFAVFYGLDWIATVPPTAKLTAMRFGRERANLVFGWVFAGHQLGAAVAAFGGGLSRTALDTYLPAFFAAGGLCLIAASLVLTLTTDTEKPAAVPATPAGGSVLRDRGAGKRSWSIPIFSIGRSGMGLGRRLIAQWNARTFWYRGCGLPGAVSSSQSRQGRRMMGRREGTFHGVERTLRAYGLAGAMGSAEFCPRSGRDASACLGAGASEFSGSGGHADCPVERLAGLEHRVHDDGKPASALTDAIRLY